MDPVNHAVPAEPKLHTAIFQFIFPFSLKKDSLKAVDDCLQGDGFRRFSLENRELEDAYYGGAAVVHERLERFYLPFTAQALFPREDGNGFQRFSREFGLHCRMNLSGLTVPFSVLSADVLVCPFQLGFITLRVSLDQPESFSLALEFADRFRTLENRTHRDQCGTIECGGETFSQTEDLLFGRIARGLKPFLNTDQSEMGGAYFQTLPFFVDERMQVIAYYGFDDKEEAKLDHAIRYRASQLDGIQEDGEPAVSASDPGYIETYCREHEYARWGPDTFYIANEQTFCCLSRSGGEIRDRLISQLYGEYYYAFLLNLFHQIVLLKLSNLHSRLRINRDVDEIESLIYLINSFSAKFYFREPISQSQGRELFLLLRRVYGNEELFKEVKLTLNDLFQYQETYQAKRRDTLLMILTIFTVISGIYGMNLVIEDLKGTIDWSRLTGYSPFEYLALLLTFTGIAVSIALTLSELWGSVRSRYRKWRYSRE